MLYGVTATEFDIESVPTTIPMMISERNPLNKQEEGVAYETPVTIEILSSAENTYLLHNDLKDILVDAQAVANTLRRPGWRYASKDRMYR